MSYSCSQKQISDKVERTNLMDRGSAYWAFLEKFVLHSLGGRAVGEGSVAGGLTW